MNTSPSIPRALLGFPPSCICLVVVALNCQAALFEFKPTGSLVTARHYHTTTLLPDGKVLVVGGRDANDAELASAELYDPASGTWTPTGSLILARSWHTATLLTNGKVLVAGGLVDGGKTACAKLYDPATGTWTETGNLVAAREVHTATLKATATISPAPNSTRRRPEHGRPPAAPRPHVIGIRQHYCLTTRSSLQAAYLPTPHLSRARNSTIQ